MGSANVDALDALFASTNNPSESLLKTALTRVGREARERLAKSSDSGDFFHASLASLSKLRGTTHADLRLTFLWDCCQYFYFTGNPSKAVAGANVMRTLSKAADQKVWLRKSTMMLGILAADLGDVAAALRSHAEALEHARAQHDSEGEVSVLVNTGIALNYGALYSEAIPCFKRAFTLAQRASLESYFPRILINLAQSHYNLNQLEEGFATASLSLKGSSDPTDLVTSVASVTRECTFVLLAAELGKLSVAREHAATCLSLAQQFGSPRAKTFANLARGVCEVYGGQVDKGFALLENALHASDDVDSMRSMVLTSLIKAYDAACQPENALKYLRQMLDHKRAVRSKSLVNLFALPVDVTTYVEGEIDLRALELKEAQLRATVAEREILNSRIEMLERLAVTADLKEEMSGEHGYRVGKLAALLAEELGIDSEKKICLEFAARLHDIGKLSLPDRILLSSTKLKEAERSFICTHTTIGAELLAKSNIPQLRIAEEIARCHHEWWNGEGYPAKLKGKRIPIHARIVALADVFDALTHGRPFAVSWTMDEAMEEIRKRKGTQFDPDLTDAFLVLVQRLRSEHSDLDEYLGRAGRNSPFLQARNKIRLMLAEERENEKKATVEGNQTRH